MTKNIQHISIIGDGGWGTTIAIYLAKKGYRINLWGPFPSYLRQIKAKRMNPKFLPGIRIPQNVIINDNLHQVVNNGQLIILAIPSEYIGNVLKNLKKFDFNDKIVLSVIKGIHISTGLRMSQLIHRELGNIHLAVLSGPTIAMEVAKGIPSTAVIACRNQKIAKTLQGIFNSKTFRIYTNTDVIGVEIGGSIKNVIAIASGVCDGLGFGTNTKAAILTRGLAEMARLGKAMGAKTKTFSGLSGLGDLATTCMSPRSRNRSVGEALGKGKSIHKIISSMNAVAEGVPTVKAIEKLGKKYKVPMPITSEVYRIIYKNKNPLRALNDLMSRKTKSE